MAYKSALLQSFKSILCRLKLQSRVPLSQKIREEVDFNSNKHKSIPNSLTIVNACATQYVSNASVNQLHPLFLLLTPGPHLKKNKPVVSELAARASFPERNSL